MTFVAKLFFFEILDIPIGLASFFPIFDTARQNPNSQHNRYQYKYCDCSIKFKSGFFQLVHFNFIWILYATCFVCIIDFPSIEPLIKFLNIAWNLIVTERDFSWHIIVDKTEWMSSIVFLVQLNNEIRGEFRVIWDTGLLIGDISQKPVIDTVDIRQVKCGQHKCNRRIMPTV